MREGEWKGEYVVREWVPLAVTFSSTLRQLLRIVFYFQRFAFKYFIEFCHAQLWRNLFHITHAILPSLAAPVLLSSAPAPALSLSFTLYLSCHCRSVSPTQALLGSLCQMKNVNVAPWLTICVCVCLLQLYMHVIVFVCAGKTTTKLSLLLGNPEATIKNAFNVKAKHTQSVRERERETNKESAYVEGESPREWESVMQKSFKCRLHFRYFDSLFPFISFLYLTHTYTLSFICSVALPLTAAGCSRVLLQRPSQVATVMTLDLFYELWTAATIMQHY